MKILVATLIGQGQRESDFCFCDEFEPIYFGMVCGNHTLEEPDGHCGCQRAVSGMRCRKATTTFTVMETQWTREEYIQQRFLTAQREAGWLDATSEKDKSEEGLLHLFTEQAKKQLRLAAHYRIGELLEYRCGVVQSRQAALSVERDRRFLETTQHKFVA